jgi:Fe-S oxidoreductase
MLNAKARSGITRDSLIVGVFILLHVGSRFLGESLHLANIGVDRWQPLASTVAGLWSGWLPGPTLEIARHVAWWMALGLILVFIPYFPYSKHIHIFFAPLNDLLHPDRRSIGELDPLDFEDESVEQFGVSRIEDLSWKGIMDAYACIMCNRCQDACPAYYTGKILSPAALEINKRYLLNQVGTHLAGGRASEQNLIEAAIPAEAIWACTACGACIDICPVANEPMRDILEIRRHLVLMENAFPEELQVTFRGMERSANPWNIPSEERLAWAEGLDVPTVGEMDEVDLLWWVGCAPATDPRAQETARAFARVLNKAGVNYAVLGSEERCTGDSARRAGNEYLFSEMALANVDVLNRVGPKRIITTCPHCLHTLKNEYPAFGGHYEVIHHTQLLDELLKERRLELETIEEAESLAFHDPCYLGRQNGLFDEPRDSLRWRGLNMVELPRSKAKSFCCGAGGAQMWKEEEPGEKRVSIERIEEAQRAHVKTLAVGCPFCMIMLNDAAASEGKRVAVRDVVELVDEWMQENS